MLAKLMGGAAPPPREDAPILARMAKIGIVPDRPFQIDKLDSAVQAALRDVPQKTLEKIEAHWLPAPRGDFFAMLRTYWPKASDPSIINGTWQPPGIVKVG